jgi:hypothetical protein
VKAPCFSPASDLGIGCYFDAKGQGRIRTMPHIQAIGVFTYGKLANEGMILLHGSIA